MLFAETKPNVIDLCLKGLATYVEDFFTRLPPLPDGTPEQAQRQSAEATCRALVQKLEMRAEDFQVTAKSLLSNLALAGSMDGQDESQER